jgi:hypothetical protein
MAGPSIHGSGPRRFAIPLPGIRLNGEKPCVEGQEATFHTLIFFVGAGGNTRVLLNVFNPVCVWAYIGAYGGCVLAGLVIGAVIRSKQDDRLSRMWGAGFALAGFVAVSLLTVVHSPHTAIKAASYAPVSAAAVVVSFTIPSMVLARCLPAKLEQENVTQTSVPKLPGSK